MYKTYVKTAVVESVFNKIVGIDPRLAALLKIFTSLYFFIKVYHELCFR